MLGWQLCCELYVLLTWRVQVLRAPLSCPLIQHSRVSAEGLRAIFQSSGFLRSSSPPSSSYGGVPRRGRAESGDLAEDFAEAAVGLAVEESGRDTARGESRESGRSPLSVPRSVASQHILLVFGGGEEGGGAARNCTEARIAI